MPKKPHLVDIEEREQMTRASSYSIYFRRDPDFSIREDGFANLLGAITPKGRAFLISTDMRINERNKS